MLYVWTKNYPQVVGTCSGHHGQLISQNCVLTKIRAEPPPPLMLTVAATEGVKKWPKKLYLLVLYIGFLAPFLLRGLTWAML